MISSLWTAASGMVGQQKKIDTISNNLSNVNTVGFKKSRVEFEDLIYQTQRLAGSRSHIQARHPLGIQIGSGVKVSSTQKLFVQGTPQKTSQPLDLAIVGEGFIRVKMSDGQAAYTRSGNLKIDANGDLVTSQGYYLEPPIHFDSDVMPESILISQDGIVEYKKFSMGPNEENVFAGDIVLHRFVNPAGLESVGENLFKETVASGSSFEGVPNTQGFGQLLQGFQEGSNVDIVSELVNMIVAQRAYEFSSKAIQTSDSLLATAVSLKR